MLHDESPLPYSSDNATPLEHLVATSDFDYSTVRAGRHQQLRQAIFAAAAELLADSGPDGLSVRAIAASVGASTKVIYSHFGGKPGIVAALYSDGFSRLSEQMATAAAHDGSIVERLDRLATAYRLFGVSSPHIYELMYGPRARELLPTRAHRTAASPAQRVMSELFQQGQEDGTFIRADPAHQARTLWAMMHGTVSLELTTWFDAEEGARRIQQAVAMVVASQAAR